jgi:hypothetical protein
MKYDEFIAEYEKAGNKAAFVKKHIVTEYVPYEAKVAEVEVVLKRSSYKKVNDKQVFYQDSPMCFMFFMMRLIARYTDIEFEDDEYLAVFNAISEKGLLEEIAKAIPHKEYETFNTVLKMAKDDLMENYRSIPGFFDSKVEALGLTLNALAEAASQIEKKEE